MHIQNFGFSGSQLLDEVLSDASVNAINGAGAYAFVSLRGVNLYLDDTKFCNFIENHAFTLIIGIDEITNTRTLTKLIELQILHTNLTVKVFYKQTGNEIFHVKFSWFKYADGSGKLIIGSGNLTLSGLRKNVEAFTVEELSHERMIELEEYWSSWLYESENYLRELDDEIVTAKAIQNENRFRNLQRINRILEREDILNEVNEIIDNVQLENFNIDDIDEGVWFFDNNDVLIMDLPRERWGQASFKRDIVSDFFGIVQNDENYNIVLRYINDTDIVDEVREFKYKPNSSNHYMELGKMKFLDDRTAPPLVIFIKVAERTYLYDLFEPSNVNYQALYDYLAIHNQALVNQKKWAVSSCNAIEDIISTLSLNQYRH